MPRNDWSAKRERQFEHIKSGLQRRGKGTKLAAEIAARTVNKERAQRGEAREASESSVNDLSPERRGGLRSHSGTAGRTLAQLRSEASERGLRGRSKMNKAQLEGALKR